MSAVGFVANPASGKDIRRLVARASVFDNNEKRAIVERCLAGIAAVGDGLELLFMPDTHHITASAIDAAGLTATAVPSPHTGTALDTTAAARALAGHRCGAVVTLGGDGTNRAFAKGWRDAPLLPISTGTNNVFPVLTEATVAGAAAGLVASGRVPLAAVSERVKTLHVAIEDEPDDLALIDAVLTTDRFVGSRALFDASHLIAAVVTRAEPAAVGIAAIAGLVEPVSVAEDRGLVLHFGGDGPHVIRAPIAPGHYQTIAITKAEALPCGASMTLRGPGTLAFDGERERVLKPGQRATLTLERDGPAVIDIPRALAAGARAGCFAVRPEGGCHAH